MIMATQLVECFAGAGVLCCDEIGRLLPVGTLRCCLSFMGKAIDIHEKFSIIPNGIIKLEES